MKIDFTKIKVEVKFGEFLTFDVCHELGNIIHQSTPDIGVDDTARAIYYATGEIEVPEEHLDAIRTIVENAPIAVAYKKALLEVLGK